MVYDKLCVLKNVWSTMLDCMLVYEQKSLYGGMKKDAYDALCICAPDIPERGASSFRDPIVTFRFFHSELVDSIPTLDLRHFCAVTTSFLQMPELYLTMSLTSKPILYRVYKKTVKI